MDATSVRMPADRGLVGLGFMMQLWSGAQCIVALTLMAVFTFSGLPTLTWLLILGVYLAIGFAQLVAGTELRSVGLHSLARVRAFAITAAVGAIVLIATATWGSRSSFPWAGASWLLLDMIAWPATLVALLHRPTVREWFSRVAEGEVDVEDRNRAIESTGAIMVALGASGSVCAAVVLLAAMRDGTSVMPSASNSPWLWLALAAFLLRCVVHVFAGVRAMRGADPSEFTQAVRRYVGAHWISVTLVLGALVVAVALAEKPAWRRSPTFELTSMMLIGALAIVSLWPLLLRSRTQQLERDEREHVAFGRPADGGLTTVGWFLCAYAAGSFVPAMHAAIGDGFGGVMQLGQLPGPVWFLDASLPSWFGVIGVALAAWGGFELCTMTTRARIAAIAVAVVTLAVALYTQATQLDELGAIATMGGPTAGIHGVINVQMLLLSFVFPVLAITMALRAPRA